MNVFYWRFRFVSVTSRIWLISLGLSSSISCCLSFPVSWFLLAKLLLYELDILKNQNKEMVYYFAPSINTLTWKE